MALRLHSSNPTVGMIGVVCGLVAGYLTVLLVGVLEPTTRTGVSLDRWVFVLVALSTAAYLWQKPSGYAAAASGAYLLANTMLLVVLVSVLLRVFPRETGTEVGALGSFDVLYLLLLAAAMIALGRLFVRRRDAAADQ